MNSSSVDLRATAAETARQTRALLAELDDPNSDLTASRATRNRLQGAALALDALVDQHRHEASPRR
ncbi:hypothetical protein [Pseudonocardia alni]|uniref:Uncharacterized protein n=1 Tax=Pseudonocardia alni TaxID=33907 RepID=A0A852VVB3_PSEA5|nr:hypothetical protein [Pseudonocardia antarctica]NYG00357.1 hypothetical protein [Pseudonocardia antarctica]